MSPVPIVLTESNRVRTTCRTQEGRFMKWDLELSARTSALLVAVAASSLGAGPPTAPTDSPPQAAAPRTETLQAPALPNASTPESKPASAPPAAPMSMRLSLAAGQTIEPIDFCNALRL